MRNQTYEQALQKSGVEFDYVEGFPPDAFDVTKSLRNQARLVDSLDGSLVNEYAVADKEGFHFPALVAYRLSPKSKLILIDGNHRLAAKIKNNRKAIDVYLVKTTDKKVIDRLTWKFNNMVNGRRLSRDEAMEHAVTFVRTYGVTITEAAKEWNVPQSSLSQRIIAEESKETMRKHNVRVSPAMGEAHFKWLAPLKQIGEDVFLAAAQVVSSSGLSESETADMTRDVRRQGTTEEKLKKVEEYANSEKVQERKAETKGGQTKVRRNYPRERFLRSLKELRNVMEDYEAKAIQPTNSEWKQYREMALSVSQRLVRMFALGSVPQGDQEVG